MNVDLFSIINNEGQKIEFAGTVQFTHNTAQVVAHVTGEVVNFAGRLDITASGNAHICDVCARCLQPVDHQMKLSITETAGPGEDEVPLDGTVLDIDSLVAEYVVINLPIRMLCQKDCKGFCSRCGTDLNTSACKCVDEEIDQRFAKLKDLLKD